MSDRIYAIATVCLTVGLLVGALVGFFAGGLVSTRACGGTGMDGIEFGRPE